MGGHPRAGAMVETPARGCSVDAHAGVWVRSSPENGMACGAEVPMGGQDVRTIEGSGATLASNTLNSAVTYKIEDCEPHTKHHL